jgi:integrase
VKSFHRIIGGAHPMPRKRNPIPSYLLHTQTGRARAVWSDQTGRRRFQMLPGAYDSPESRNAFTALLLEQQAAPHRVATPDRGGPTMAELLLRYFKHAERHYRGPGDEPTSEMYEIRIVIRVLRELYAETPVSEFGPLCVKAARQRWVNDGRSRSECNRRVAIIKRIFKWAVSEELVSPVVFHAVASVVGLQKGRTSARENEPIRPVDDVVVDATLPFLNPHVRGLVEFQRLTGCRPGEACTVRRCDIDTGGPQWVYRPPHHKTAGRGHSRAIVLGPKAQELVRGFFTPVLDDFLFNPIRAAEERREGQATGQKPPNPRRKRGREQVRRGKPKGRYLRAKYDRWSYGMAIDRACDRAFPLPESLARLPDESHSDWLERLTEEERTAVKAWRKRHHWQPNQLRHSFATRIRKQYGLEAAQVLLGHTRADVTQVYAERDTALANKVAGMIG